MPAHTEIEMRSGGASCRSDKSDSVSSGNLLTCGDLDLGKMEGLGHQPVAMVDEDRFAREEEVVDKRDRPVRDGENGSACGQSVISAHVRLRCFLAVEDAPPPEVLGRRRMS